MMKQSHNKLMKLLGILTMLIFGGIDFTLAQEEEFQVPIGDQVTYNIFAFQNGEENSREVSMLENGVPQNITVKDGLKVALEVSNVSSSDGVLATATIDSFIFEDQRIDTIYSEIKPLATPVFTSYWGITWEYPDLLYTTTGNASDWEFMVRDITEDDGSSNKGEIKGDLFIWTQIDKDNEYDFVVEYNRKLNMKTGWIEYLYVKLTFGDGSVYEMGYKLASFDIASFSAGSLMVCGIIGIAFLLKQKKITISS